MHLLLQLKVCKLLCNVQIRTKGQIKLSAVTFYSRVFRMNIVILGSLGVLNKSVKGHSDYL